MCYLRYDDTNPEKADQQYIGEIQELVEWLGECLVTREIISFFKTFTNQVTRRTRLRLHLTTSLNSTN